MRHVATDAIIIFLLLVDAANRWPAATCFRMAAQAAVAVVGHPGSRLRDGVRVVARYAAQLSTRVAATGHHLFDLADGAVAGSGIRCFDKNRPEKFPGQAWAEIERPSTRMEDARFSLKVALVANGFTQRGRQSARIG